MRIMTTIYIDDKHVKFFEKNVTINRSALIRELLDNYMSKKKR